MNCNNCGAPMQLLLEQRHFYCNYCTSRYFPVENKDGIRILEADSDLDCPVCKTSMVYGFIGETQLHFCKSCRGMLFDQVSFLKVVDYLRENSSLPQVELPPVDLTALNRQLTCPICGRSMSTHLYGGPGNLVVDNCNHCQHLWLDHNEFTRIIRAPGRKRRIIIDEQEQEMFESDD